MVTFRGGELLLLGREIDRERVRVNGMAGRREVGKQRYKRQKLNKWRTF